nr:MAG TPA: hypothetical protein [Caudoviricetes sp.]
MTLFTPSVIIVTVELRTDNIFKVTTVVKLLSNSNFEFKKCSV